MSSILQKQLGFYVTVCLISLSQLFLATDSQAKTLVDGEYKYKSVARIDGSDVTVTTYSDYLNGNFKSFRHAVKIYLSRNNVSINCDNPELENILKEMFLDEPNTSARWEFDYTVVNSGSRYEIKYIEDTFLHSGRLLAGRLFKDYLFGFRIDLETNNGFILCGETQINELYELKDKKGYIDNTDPPDYTVGEKLVGTLVIAHLKNLNIVLLRRSRELRDKSIKSIDPSARTEALVRSINLNPIEEYATVSVQLSTFNKLSEIANELFDKNRKALQANRGELVEDDFPFLF